MNKHAPGPWKVSPTDDTVVIDADGREVAAIDGDYNDPDTWPLMEANARLIAAAPDLLEALKDLFSIANAEGVVGDDAQAHLVGHHQEALTGLLPRI